jgi:hypothetical protein
MSFNIRKLSNIVQKNSIYFKNPNFLKVEHVYLPVVGICTVGGFAYGCKMSLDHIDSYKTIPDEINGLNWMYNIWFYYWCMFINYHSNNFIVAYNEINQ